MSRSVNSNVSSAFVVVLAVVLATVPVMADVTFVDVTAAQFPDGLSNGHYKWGDCDNDGDDDLMVGGKTIYLNDGPPNFTFTRMTDTGELAAGPHARTIWVDIDNDGDLDLFGIGNGDNERLFLNDGSCRFTDISDFDGDGVFTDMGDGAPSTTTSTGDYDADGMLDLYVGNYERYCAKDPPICGDCMTDRLWHNMADNTFEDVTVSSGVYAQEHALMGYCNVAHTPCDTDADCAPYPADSCKSGTCARGSNWVDFDNDGDQDIFVSNYRLDPNLLWENDGNGNFTNVAEARNVDGDRDGDGPNPWNYWWGHVLGSDWGDYDNDGDMDLYTAALAHCIYRTSSDHDISQLLQSAGPPDFNFTDVRPTSGMRQYDPTGLDCLAGPYADWLDWTETNPSWVDYDNDGTLDIFVTRIYNTSNREYSELYSSDGDGTFTETTSAHGVDLGIYRNYSAAWSDFDQDGDLDLVTYGAPTPEGTSTARLYRNDGGNGNDWLHLQPVGMATSSGGGTNRSGVGVRVTATHAGTTMMREVQGGFGYHTCQNSMPVEFGFGAASDPKKVDELTVRWTTGITDVFTDQPIGLMYTAYEAGSVMRGNDPSIPLTELAPGLNPYHDGTLSDSIDYYYSFDGVPDMTLYVDKDSDGGYVVLEVRPEE